MNDTIEILEQKECTGCGSCAAVCPNRAIQMEYSDDGFLYPHLVRDNCVNCGSCKKACPIINRVEGNLLEDCLVYQHKDTDILHKSSSGGVFWGLAKWVLAQGGFVVGCIVGHDCLPEHICSSNMDDVRKMQGSKYVQSTISFDTYEEIKRVLDKGKKVLFSGTPCQLAGIQRFLNKGYDDLYLVDLICHGVGSPGVYLNYIKKIEARLGEKVNNVCFRDKSVKKYPNNHSIIMKTDNKCYRSHSLSDSFGNSFSHGRILRESCYKCIYANKMRLGDITIGDYGEISRLPDDSYPSMDGFSIVSINTSKGNEIVEGISNDYITSSLAYNYTQSNLTKPTQRPKERDKLYNMRFSLDRIDGDTGITLRISMLDRLKNCVPHEFKEKIKRIINW